jgi:hypothetical protein
MKTNTKPDGTVYPLRTIADIFNLPTHGHMERCLAELQKIMLPARATADLMTGIAESQGLPKDSCKIVWPDVLEWIDDGKGELGCDFNAGDENLMSLRITKENNT